MLLGEPLGHQAAEEAGLGVQQDVLLAAEALWDMGLMMRKRKYGSRAVPGAGNETSCSSLLPFFLGESFSTSSLADLPCFVILPVDLEMITLCKDHVNRQLWEHLVAKLLMPGALELSLEAAAIEESTETRCLISWMSALTPELFYKRKQLTLTDFSPSGVMGEKVAVVSTLGVEHGLSACSKLDLLLKVLSNTCSEVWAGGMCWGGLKHKTALSGTVNCHRHVEEFSVFYGLCVSRVWWQLRTST